MSGFISGQISRDVNRSLGETRGRSISGRIANGAGTSVPGIHDMMAVGVLIAAVVPGAALPVAAFFGSLWQSGKHRR